MDPASALTDRIKSFSNFPSHHEDICNGHIVFILYLEKAPMKDCIEIITSVLRNASLQLMDVKAYRVYLEKVLKTFKRKRNSNLKRNFNNVVDFLNQRIILPSLSPANNDSQPAPTLCSASSPFHNHQPLVDITPLVNANSITSSPNNSMHSSRPALNVDQSGPVTSSTAPCLPLSTPNTPPIKRSRKDCENCFSVKRSVRDAQNKLKTVRSEKRLLKKKYATKRINQDKRRKSLRIFDLRANVKALSKENDELKRTIEEHRQLVETLQEIKLKLVNENNCLCKENSKLMSSNNDLHSLNKNLKKDLKAAQISLDNYAAILEENSSPSVIPNKIGNSYTSSIRKVIYKCLSNEVPAATTGVVVKYAVQNLTNSSLSSVPNITTATRMAREMGVIADIQSAEVILSSDAMTLSWDATTIDGQHINEIHISTRTSILTLNAAQLPGGCAEDYVQHITDTLDNIGITYSSFKGVPHNDVCDAMKGKILCTLTDRAAANHAAVVLLEEKLNKSLLDLKCNLHPLDGLANGARATLRKLDIARNVRSYTLGGPSCAVSVIQGISKMRYKEKGDPLGFKLFLKSEGLKPGTFLRYVGNRLHVLFHLAGTVYHYRSQLIAYLRTQCNATTLANCLANDLSNPFILNDLQLLGIVGKAITAPWMALCYTSSTSRNHSEIARCLVNIIPKLQTFASAPDQLYSATEDVFGREYMHEDTILQSLKIVDRDPIALYSTTECLLQEFVTILYRQLKEYMPDGSNSEAAMAGKADTAPAHNIWAERTLGILDKQIRRAPIAALDYIDAKVKVKTNATLDWLDKNSDEEQSKIITFARCQAVKNKALHNLRQDGLQMELLKRQKQKEQKKDRAKRSKIANGIKAAIKGPNALSDPVFKDIAASVLGYLELALNQPADLIGRYIVHTWNLNGEDVVYNGRFVKLSKKKDIFTVCYWLENESEDDSTESRVKVIDIVTDMVTEDLQIV